MREEYSMSAVCTIEPQVQLQEQQVPQQWGWRRRRRRRRNGVGIRALRRVLRQEEEEEEELDAIVNEEETKDGGRRGGEGRLLSQVMKTQTHEHRALFTARRRRHEDDGDEDDARGDGMAHERMMTTTMMLKNADTNQHALAGIIEAPMWRGNADTVTSLSLSAKTDGDERGRSGDATQERGGSNARDGGQSRNTKGGGDSKGKGLRWHGWRWQHCVSGAVAGGVVEIVMYPLDTLKTRMQTSLANGGSGAGVNMSTKIVTGASPLWPKHGSAAHRLRAAAAPATSALLRTRSRTLSMFQRLRASGGLRGLYSGCMNGMIGTAVADAVYFGVYEPMKETCLSAMPEKYHSFAPAISAASASLIASVVRVPSEVIKQRMQSGQGFRSAQNVFSGIMRNYGVRGLYNGAVPLLLRDLPFNTIEFAVYENLKITAKRLKAAALVAAGADANLEWRSVALSNGETGLMGALAGLFTAAITTPMDVLKTRLMVQATGARYANIADAAVKIVHEEGLHVLFQGLTPRLLWISFGGCVFFTALEGMEAALNRPVYSGLRGGAKAP